MYLLFKGDAAKLTGKKETMHGAVFSEAMLLEGHRAGEVVWVIVSNHYTYRYRHEMP